MAARFVLSAPNQTKLPDLGVPEVAFAGRSNVGKSSLVGRLIGSPKLVRISRTPGRTQLLNLFEVDKQWSFVDLPGYGYAKLSKKQRKDLKEMVLGYFSDRVNLRVAVMVLDARRTEVSVEDLEMAQWIMAGGHNIIAAVTKCDLVPKNRRFNNMRKIEKSLGLETGAALQCSSKSGEGKSELLGRLKEVCS